MTPLRRGPPQKRQVPSRRIGRPYAIRWTDRARDDLTEIGDFIAKDSPAAAARWVETLIKSVERVGRFPLSGRIVPEVDRDDVREVIRASYRIVYRVREDAIDVLTVFEGHRRLPAGIVEKAEGDL